MATTTERVEPKRKVIGEIQRRKGAKICVSLADYGKGQLYVDVRDWWLNGDKYQPTQKGIMIPAKCLSDVLTLLEQVEAESGIVGAQ
jgi:hypothetical protein